MNSSEVGLWMKAFEDLLDDAKSRYKPKIVLWGPGGHNAAGLQKRRTIKQNILKEHPGASVIFPEDAQIRSLSKRFVGDPDLQDILQATVADIIFALDISQGVGEEVARYSRIESIANRLVVIARDSHKNGYPSIVRRRLQIEYFREEDLRDCSRASNYCREQVRAWLIKMVSNMR